MKTLKSLTFLFSLLLVSACSNDDNSAKGYFPTNIELTDYTNSINNKSVTIDYNRNNEISEIILEDNNGIKTKQYSYTNGKITSVSNSGFLGGPDVRTFVYNASGILSSIVDETDGSTETYLINYDAPSNTYTLIDGTESSSVQLDESGNPYQYSFSYLTSNIVLTLDSNEEGVFKLSLEKPSKIQISHTSYKTLIVNSLSLKLKENRLQEEPEVVTILLC